MGTIIILVIIGGIIWAIVSGIVATHDLELSKMQQESPDRFHNYCFRDTTF